MVAWFQEKYLFISFLKSFQERNVTRIKAFENVVEKNVENLENWNCELYARFGACHQTIKIYFKWNQKDICISDSEINDQAQTKIAADELFPDFNTNWLKMQDYETEPL